ncbi:MAG: murein transglycosylase A [Allosphingosinicella sp.]|uniref:murein transglycosylase A n=1 Tax=Allosphingosinicella sp. TaxID=2823234 RepID=UPI003950CF82
MTRLRPLEPFRSSDPRRPLLLAGMLVALASCAQTAQTVQPAPAPAPAPAPSPTPSPSPTPGQEPATAIAAGLRAGPAVEALGLTPAAAEAALAAFRISCPSAVRRTDQSGLTRPEDWAPPCDAAAGWPTGDALRFFATHFETVEVGGGNAFATGYFEPEIAGSRTRRPGYETPVYAKPADLVEADLGQWSNDLSGRRIRGRVENGNLVLYHDRAAIEAGALSGRGLEIAWVADPVDFFFLQIQGSGRLALPDGGVMRIGYAGQNGREYVAIGRLLRERGLVQSPVTMQAITEWLRANREQGRAIMRENRSYIFFTELTGPGPLGSLGRPVTPRVTVAADPRFVPLGAPVVLSAMEAPVADGLWVAQDVGGAIRGANRFDTFWGAGAEAARIAGGMSARGRALVLLPRGTLARHDGPAAQR